MSNPYTKFEDYENIKQFLDPLPPNFEPDIKVDPFKEDYTSSIVIDNLPKVDSVKAKKLEAVLLKIYSAVCPLIAPSDIYLPIDSNTNLTPGFAFIRFPTPEDAENAVRVTNNHPLDKNHTFKVSLYSDLVKVQSIPDEYVPVTELPFRQRPDITGWLCDPFCRDQFFIRAGHDTEVFWSNYHGEQPSLIYNGEREKPKSWCESIVTWSPRGTYLATYHPPGIRLWSGNLFEPQNRFMHQSVELAEFSPCENYLVTYVFNSYETPDAIIVWDVQRTAKIRTFALKDARDSGFWASAEIEEESKGKKITRVMKGKIDSYDNHSGSFKVVEGITIHQKISLSKITVLQEPNRLKWSHDGRYVARLGANIIQIYELPTMELLDKKSIACKDILDFVWSPNSNLISYWSPASGNLPAIISIVSIPDRNIISSRKLFDVQDGKMIWQNDGDYLCVKMTKVNGKKKSIVLMLFRIKENEIPVEILELNENVLDIQWEPSKDKFSVVTGDLRSSSVSFYTMGGLAAVVAQTSSSKSNAAPPKKEVTLLYTLPNKQCTEVIWSPAGTIAAITYYASDSCVFELHDVDNNVSLSQKRHDRCTKLLWDPTGRTIASCTLTPLRQTAVRGNPEDGFNIYTFQGQLLVQIRKEKLYQFQWRPYPNDFLTPAEKKAVIKNLKKYEKMFDREDKAKRQQLEYEAQSERRKLASSFLSLLSSKKQNFSNLRSERVKLRNGYDSEDDENFQIEVQMEESIISSKTQVVS